MPIGSVLIGDFSRVTLGYWPASARTVSTTSATSTTRLDQREQILFAREKVKNLGDALRTVDHTWSRGSRSRNLEAASVSSASDLGLATDSTSATLASTEEVNATPTSYSTHGPVWTGSSTAALTIDGEYNGSLGADTLTFRVNWAGTVGVDPLRIQVFDSLGNKVDDLTALAGDPPGTEYVLDSGLIVTIGEGVLAKNDTATLQVSDSVGSAVDPNAALGGVRLDDPDLQYGYDVTAGSFTVNGTTILVGAADSLNDVLQRINDSDAGVTASYSAETETVTLVSDTPGSDGEITLADDTSGFLAAMKLDAAVLVEGTDGYSDRTMSDVPLFSGVAAGIISVNGIDVAFDPAADSLQDLLDRIEASGAEVATSIDPSGSAVTFASTDQDQVLTLDDNGTGLLAALDIAAGSYDPVRSSDGRGAMDRSRAHRIARALQEAAEAFNGIFGLAVAGQEEGSWLKRTRQDLQTLMEGLLETTTTQELARIGLRFDGRAGQDLRFRLTEKDRSGLISSILRKTRTVENVFFRTQASPSSGLVDEMLERLDVMETYLDGALAKSGGYVDTYA